MIYIYSYACACLGYMYMRRDAIYLVENVGRSMLAIRHEGCKKNSNTNLFRERVHHKPNTQPTKAVSHQDHLLVRRD